MIAMLFIYIPIIRIELQKFIHMWNRHKIRPQPHRAYAIPGIPWMNFHHPGRQGDIRNYKVAPDQPTLDHIKDLYSD